MVKIPSEQQQGASTHAADGKPPPYSETAARPTEADWTLLVADMIKRLGMTSGEQPVFHVPMIEAPSSQHRGILRELREIGKVVGYSSLPKSAIPSASLDLYDMLIVEEGQYCRPRGRQYDTPFSYVRRFDVRAHLHYHSCRNVAFCTAPKMSELMPSCIDVALAHDIPEIRASAYAELQPSFAGKKVLYTGSHGKHPDAKEWFSKHLREECPDATIIGNSHVEGTESYQTEGRRMELIWLDAKLDEMMTGVLAAFLELE